MQASLSGSIFVCLGPVVSSPKYLRSCKSSSKRMMKVGETRVDQPRRLTLRYSRTHLDLVDAPAGEFAVEPEGLLLLRGELADVDLVAGPRAAWQASQHCSIIFDVAPQLTAGLAASWLLFDRGPR